MDDIGFIKGFTFGWTAKKGEYRTAETIDSLDKLKETGTKWIALSFDIKQKDFHSTEISFDYGYTVTDREITFVIEQAHKRGMQVCLKPVINLKNELWRARINFPDEANSHWDSWFQSYTNFITHYAEIAEETNCKMLCIGCEMLGTERKEKHWRKVIEAIRNVYSGFITYNANHGKEDHVKWFDAVDIIGTSAYYPVATLSDSSEETMLMAWEAAKGHLYNLHKQYNKQILFMEIGCRSANGCSTMPWDSYTDLSFNEDEQARFYNTALKAFWNEPWFSGFFWWDWKHHLYHLEDAKKDKDFSIYGKKAELIIKQWYSKP